MKILLKKTFSKLCMLLIILTLFVPLLANSQEPEIEPNWDYFAKLESEPVYDSDTGGSSTVGTPYGGGKFEIHQQETLVGFNKNCTFSAFSKCDQNQVGFTPLNQ